MTTKEKKAEAEYIHAQVKLDFIERTRNFVDSEEGYYSLAWDFTGGARIILDCWKPPYDELDSRYSLIVYIGSNNWLVRHYDDLVQVTSAINKLYQDYIK